MQCLYPDCEQTFPDTEAGKRDTIAHINADHADAHVLIACSHEFKEIERYDALVKLHSDNGFGKQGETVSFPQVKSECARCGQFEIADAPEVTVTQDSVGNDVLSIPAKDDVEGTPI